MTHWQLSIDANDPARLARFWALALGYQAAPTGPASSWLRHYRRRLGGQAAFDDRLFDPKGLGPPIKFQPVPEAKAGKNRLHLDLYPSGRDDDLTQQERVRIVETRVAQLVEAGALVVRRERDDDLAVATYFVVMQDPEGNEFCVS